MKQTVQFDIDLINKYDKAGPRYTSYPTAVQFHENFATDAYKAAIERSNQASRNASHPTPLSLYFHIPFCDTVCFYCGCNKIATKDRTKGAPYLERVHKEMTMQSALFDKDRVVEQLHWGGGTPTFISHDEMRGLMNKTRELFTLADDDRGEYSIEIDPREVKTDTIALLREIGFNRMSLGVQDIDPVVQKAVNRIQPQNVTDAAIKAARSEGFKSISIDLIYGLPFQSVERFSATLDAAIELNPDRLSVFNYAHLPDLFKPQRRIDAATLPSPQEKLDILAMTIERLGQAGYVYIGMDHFAKPNDELAIAQREGTLYRNFQGYSTHADCDLIAFGITSIGKVANSYSQNVKDLESYYELIDAGKLPIFRGVELDQDDILRREVITQLVCHFELDMASIDAQFNIEFENYFADAINALTEMQQDKLVSIQNRRIEVQPAGHLLIRNICMVFDKYLQQSTQRFSKVI